MLLGNLTIYVVEAEKGDLKLKRVSAICVGATLRSFVKADEKSFKVTGIWVIWLFWKLWKDLGIRAIRWLTRLPAFSTVQSLFAENSAVIWGISESSESCGCEESGQKAYPVFVVWTFLTSFFPKALLRSFCMLYADTALST